MVAPPLFEQAPAKQQAAVTTPRVPWLGGCALSGLLALASPCALAQTTARCFGWTAELSVVEGEVDIQMPASASWTRTATGAALCLGDTIRVGPGARATLLLPDQSALRLAENSTVMLEENRSADSALIRLIRGLIHVISRDPRQLQFTTPFGNAGLEGTEFDIRVSDRETAVAVLEGTVRLTTPSGEVGVSSGHLAVATAGQAPTTTELAAPIELMRWASYYPLIIDDALPSLEPNPEREQDAEFLARRAMARLDTAQLAAAQSDLDRALSLAPRQPTAHAVLAMLAIARSDLATAASHVETALSLDARSVPALIARSHVEQARGENVAAEQTLRAAMTLEPTNSIVLTRVAELRLAAGDTRAAVAYAERARTLAPGRSTPLVVLGFAQLSAFETSPAQTRFLEAVKLEPEAPLARIGLALAATQRGDLAEGRRQLELAVANDPANGLTRSYMARLYQAQNRGALTASQLTLAKTLAPNDWTPLLYSALYSLQRNQPVAALKDMRAATALTAAEPVFRSRLGMDQDLATRSAALAHVYTTLGFGRPALVDAWHVVTTAPEDYSGHRLLADIYGSEPRHEVARVSELLVSQLLQPANVTPIKPTLGQARFGVAERAGPSSASFDEFSPPIVTNGSQINASASSGGHNTAGTEISLGGMHDRISYSAGYYRFETDGFHANGDVDATISNAFLQFRPSATASVLAELRSSRTTFGDLSMAFDRDVFLPQLRNDEATDSLRVSSRHDLSGSGQLLVSSVYQTLATSSDNGSAFGLAVDRKAVALDLQHILALDTARVQSGVFLAGQNERQSAHSAQPPPESLLVIDRANDQNSRSVYSYAHFAPVPTLRFTVGASLDRVNDFVLAEEAFNPKLGLLWRPGSKTTLRATAFRAMFDSLTTSTLNPQPSLEPSQLAGFSQVLFGGWADRAKVVGLGVDYELSSSAFVGVELTRRNTERPLVDVLAGAADLTQVAERTAQAYLLLAPTDRLAVSTRYERGHFTSTPTAIFGYTQMKMQRLPIELRHFSSNGLTAGIRASHVEQEGWFPSAALPPGTYAPGADRFWVLDAFVSYRLPNRRGELSLNADNLLDEDFHYQDIDPTNLTFAPERLVSFRFTLSF